MSLRIVEKPKNRSDFEKTIKNGHLILVPNNNGVMDKEIFSEISKTDNLFFDKEYLYMHLDLEEVPNIIEMADGKDVQTDILYLTLHEKGKIKNLTSKLLKEEETLVQKYGLEKYDWHVVVDDYGNPQIFLMKEDGWDINEDTLFSKIAKKVLEIVKKDKETTTEDRFKMLEFPKKHFYTLDLSQLNPGQQQDSIWRLFRTPIKTRKQPSRFMAEIGDVMPFSDQNLLLPVPPKNEDMYINRITHLGEGNVFRILTEMGIDTTTFQQKYKCPHSEMEFYSLVPMFLVSKNLEIYKRKTECYARHFDKKYLWWLQDPEDMYRPSKTDIAMLGSGYSYGASAYDGENRLITKAIELENGDHLICVTWEWLNR